MILTTYCESEGKQVEETVAHGTADVVADPLPGLDGVIGVEIKVERVSSHKRPTFSIADGVAWGWIDDEARERDAAVRSALLEL